MTMYEQLSPEDLAKMATEINYKLRELLVEIKHPPQEVVLLEKFSNELKTAMNTLAELHQAIYKKQGKPLPPGQPFYAREFFDWRKKQLDTCRDWSDQPPNMDKDTFRAFRDNNQVYPSRKRYTNHWNFVRAVPTEGSDKNKWLALGDIHADLTLAHIMAAHSPGSTTQIIHGGQILIEGKPEFVSRPFETDQQPTSIMPGRLPDVEIAPDGQVTWRIQQ